MSYSLPRLRNVNFSPWLIAIFIGVLLIAALWLTSYYTVGADSEGVVLRFGRFLKTVQPGLHFKLPFGIDRVTVVPTRRQLKLEFGFTTPGQLTNAIQPSQEPDEEKSMVTGDLNAALVEWWCNIALKTRGSISSTCEIRAKPSAICPRPRCAKWSETAQ